MGSAHSGERALRALFARSLLRIAFSRAHGLSAYLAKAVSYSQIYGSLAAIPILLLWIYIVWLIILVRRGADGRTSRNRK